MDDRERLDALDDWRWTQEWREPGCQSGRRRIGLYTRVKVAYGLYIRVHMTSLPFWVRRRNRAVFTSLLSGQRGATIHPVSSIPTIPAQPRSVPRLCSSLPVGAILVDGLAGGLSEEDAEAGGRRRGD